MGSQGDGAAQFLCKGKEAQAKVSTCADEERTVHSMQASMPEKDLGCPHGNPDWPPVPLAHVQSGLSWTKAVFAIKQIPS